MTLFYSSCSCLFWKQAGKHKPGCPMDSRCSFCEKSQQICKKLGKCAGILKTHPSFANADIERGKVKVRLANKKKDLIEELTILINQGAVNHVLQQKIDKLKAAFNALTSKKHMSPADLEEAEKILFQLRRIFVTQKAAHDKNLKEKETAALAECDADDFALTRLD